MMYYYKTSCQVVLCTAPIIRLSAKACTYYCWKAKWGSCKSSYLVL